MSASHVSISHTRAPENFLTELYGKRDDGDVYLEAEDGETLRIHSIVMKAGLEGTGLVLPTKKKDRYNINLNVSLPTIELLVAWIYRIPWPELALSPNLATGSETRENLYALADLADKYRIPALQQELVDIFEGKIVPAQTSATNVIAGSYTLIEDTTKGRILGAMLTRAQSMFTTQLQEVLRSALAEPISKTKNRRLVALKAETSGFNPAGGLFPDVVITIEDTAEPDQDASDVAETVEIKSTHSKEDVSADQAATSNLHLSSQGHAERAQSQTTDQSTPAFETMRSSKRVKRQ